MNDTSGMMDDNRTDICTHGWLFDSFDFYGQNIIEIDLSTKCKCCGQELPEDQRPKIPEYIVIHTNIKQLKRHEKNLRTNYV